MEPTERRLAAILFTDIVGSTSVTAGSERDGLALRDRHRARVRAQAERYHGRFVEAPGDETLSVFDSAVNAVNAALAIQRELRSDPELRLRLGLHLGETLFRQREVFGDGVNIAARVRALAEPGEILATGELVHSIRGQPNLESSPRGERQLKNVGRPVALYALGGEPAPPTSRARRLGAPRLPRGFWIAAVGAGALAAISLLVWRQWLAPLPSAESERSLAVLPFADLSAARDQEPFADGLSEELIHTLSRVDGLRVTARTSSFSFKGRNEDVRVIGERLGVGSVVEGSVRKDGDRLRITAQLVRTADGFHEWSESFDRGVDDVFAVQEEIARAVAQALKGRVLNANEGPRVEPPTENLPAYEAYLAADYFSERGETRKAIEYYERALALDPGFVLAHAALSTTLLDLSWETRERRIVERADAESLRALELDDESADAHAHRAIVLWTQGRVDECRGHAERALQLNPGSAIALQVNAYLLVDAGRAGEAVEAMARVSQLDPLSPRALQALAQFQLFAGAPDAAIVSLRRALDLDPDSSWGRNLLSRAYGQTGRDREALEEYLRGPLPDEAKRAIRAGFDRAGGDGAIRAGLELARSQTGRPCTDDPEAAAYWLASLGEADQMFACLREAIEREGTAYLADGRDVRTVIRWSVRADPLFAPYRSDPRFADALRAGGPPEE